jgi:alkanesulfonate monooxygenase SsuD/methylene tetrahydromethanopterin reductase-like flavin-dependent oxidoreductase (luciferase family)
LAGKFVTFADMHVSPKPLQQPQPPIWVGGLSDATLKRAARFAAVWQPTPKPLADLLERQQSLQTVCERIGRRDPPETRMSFRVEFSPITGNAPPSGAERPIGHGTPSEVAADLRRYRETAGVSAFQINFHGNRDLGQLLDSMDCFVHEVSHG